MLFLDIGPFYSQINFYSFILEFNAGVLAVHLLSLGKGTSFFRCHLFILNSIVNPQVRIAVQNVM